MQATLLVEPQVPPAPRSLHARHTGVISETGVQHLIGLLREKGYQVIGPTVRDETIVYDEIASADALPIGWTDEQAGGTYRLRPRPDRAFFGYSVGPHSWKRFLFPPERRLWSATRRGADGDFRITPEPDEPHPMAFLGVHPCELAAMVIQDRVLLRGRYTDPVYQIRRADAFVVAVNCSSCSGTCFCTSMGTGPKAVEGFDLALTELIDEERHEFLVEAGTDAGDEVLSRLEARAPTEADRHAARRVVEHTAETIGKHLDTTDIRDLLMQNLDHPRWRQVGARCLGCANCTMVCPTCFCVDVEDTTDLSGQHVERRQHWDSCFSIDYSYIHGGSVRTSPEARYRQWLTHKLATWIDQFGTSGCVGCGRCITWCPVGIDLTEEVQAIRETALPPPAPARPTR